MFAYFSKYFTDAKIYAYNFFNNDGEKSTRIYQTLQPDVDNENQVVHNVDDKKLRIDVLLFVRQFKNTYYKYTNKDKFNPELYNSFVNDEHFDGGLTAFDDDDNVRIFDKYILEYIKHRNDMLTYLQCKEKDVVLRSRLDDLREIIGSQKSVDVIFAIDMSEKDLFNYCYSIIQKTANISYIKNIIFSLILKYNGEYIRMKLSAFNKNKNVHPYLILERFIT